MAAGKGETVKYVIDADTSGFARGMAAAAIESEVAGRRIDRSLSGTNKRSENNFKDIRRNAQTAASSIRNFGVAFEAFNLTSIIIGVTALSGAILELSGALAAAGSTTSILAPLLAQGGAAALAFKSGVFGLSDAFKAIGKNDGKAFAESMAKLGPAARQVAFAVAGLNKAFNSIRLNTQQALLAGVGNELLKLGGLILPTVNAGFQTIGRAMNGAFNQAAQLASQPIFSGLLATIFADTAHNITILSGALAPLLSIFTNLYLVTRPYVSLLAEQIVNLLKNASAYLGTVRGQTALNIAIQEGIIAIRELANLAGAVFGLLTSIFRTSVNSGNNLITTLTGIIRQAEAWVNSTKGQEQLISLFQFTSLAVQALAKTIGRALSLFFGLVSAFDSLNPSVQQFIVTFLATSIITRYVTSYFSKLYLAIRVLAVTLFNVVEQARIMFVAIGGLASIVLIAAAGLIFLGAVIRGPLGSALIIVGGIIAAYIGLNYLLGFVAAATAPAVAETGEAGVVAGSGLTFAARGAILLQAALLPLLVLAAGVLVILGMLGLFSSKGKQAQGASIGLGSSLGALQKSMKGVGTTGAKATNAGIAPLSDALNNVGDAANAAQGQLASFDKMNVLSPPTGGPGSGIPGVPSLPDMGALGGDLGAPTLDTGNFDKALADMEKNFNGLKATLGKGLFNPFDTIGKWIDKHPWIALAGFAAIIIAVGAAFLLFGVEVTFATLPLTLIVLGIIAIIAIVIILAQHWDAIWAGIKAVAAVAWQFIQAVWDGILGGAQAMITGVGNFFIGLWNGIVKVFSVVVSWFAGIFTAAWNGIVAIWGVVVGWFQAVWNGIVAIFMVVATFYIGIFLAAWNGIKLIWGPVTSWFGGIWNGIMGIFGAVGSWFGNIFAGAWNAIKGAFGAVTGFFQGIWNSIVSIFTTVGVAVGNAIGGAVKSAVNAVINTVANIVNTVINLINGAIGLINHLPGVHIGAIGNISLPRLAKGGLVTSPTIAQIGEAGAEAVMPLENNTGWIDQLANKINAANGSGNGQAINLTVQIGEDKVATKIIDLINERTQMSGRNAILI